MRHHRPDCGRPRPTDRVVYPVRENVVHNCFENTVEHVHPSHTTVMNHHLTRNRHVYPHSTSVRNTFNSVDEYGGSFQTPGNGPGSQVAGATSPGYGPGSQVAGAATPGYGPGSQVAGATSPGYGPSNQMVPGYGPGSQVAGAATPGYPSAGMNHWKKPNKGC
ncbi:CotD family spore coat protein [Virgibacillus byunsanensis]|uniref:CotD family spore coat protein n=1 Tax=Virgibacillus byunsanensis TaxID=570945 RepID=A0ABW3LSP8_9BACI